MIQPGTRVSQNGKKLTANSSEESKWLSLILNAIKNDAAITSGVLNALGGENATSYNTMEHYLLESEDTLTIDANTIHSLSFSVTLGSVSVSLDGGSTSVLYPVGSNINLQATTLINTEIQFEVSGTTGDNLNTVLIQTSKE